jgi:hypothetical protein
MYLFTDNAQRTSRPTATSPNITEGWYAEKYKDKTDKPLHYGSTSNPTSAVIRGKNNAYPISTMSAYGTNWTNDNLDLLFKTLKIGNFRIGQGGRFAKLPVQHQAYLDSKLLEIGIDNSGTTPKVIQPITQPQATDDLGLIDPGMIPGALEMATEAELKVPTYEEYKAKANKLKVSVEERVGREEFDAMNPEMKRKHFECL